MMMSYKYCYKYMLVTNYFCEVCVITFTKFSLVLYVKILAEIKI